MRCTTAEKKSDAAPPLEQRSTSLLHLYRTATPARNKAVGISWELWLNSITDAAETFQFELDMKYCWYAKGWTAQYQKAGSPAEDSDEFRKLLDECWHPRIKIDNIAESLEEVSSFTMCLDALSGRMHRFTKLRGECSEILNLRHFPFDAQSLAIQVGTYCDMGEVVFEPYPGRASINRSRVSRWRSLHDLEPLLVIPSADSHGLRATSGRAYHRCHIVIEVRRDFWWYAVHHVLPHCCILMMNAYIVLIERNNVEARSAVTLTLLLTTVAFQFLLLPEVPKKRYLTVLDMVMNVGLLVQLISCGLVYFNADLPYAPPGAVRQNALYSVTDESVAAIEAFYVTWVIGGWICANLALVAGAWAFELHGARAEPARGARAASSVDDEVVRKVLLFINNAPVGKLTTHRMSETPISYAHDVDAKEVRTSAI